MRLRFRRCRFIAYCHFHVRHAIDAIITLIAAMMLDDDYADYAAFIIFATMLR